MGETMRGLKWFSALLALMLAAPVRADDPREEVFYHIHTRSMRDSNGDGIGDLNGITASLDYLQKLGVTTILLTPLYPARVYHNYFAYSFEGIDPHYGTMADFRRLVRELHRRHMKIYLDMEFQYLAGDHPWWEAARRDPHSPYADWMLWKDRARGAAEDGPFGLRAIEHFGGDTFGVTTVNLKAAPVQAYFHKYLKGWIDPRGDGSMTDGVDGFRWDHMMDDLDSRGLLTHLFADWWKPEMTRLRALNPKVRFIAEQFDWGYGSEYLRAADTDFVFAFPIEKAIRSFDKAAIVNAIAGTAVATPAGKHQMIFVENHDIDRAASDPGMTPDRLRTAAALNILLQGTPIMYYGQELGMRGRLDPGYKTDASAIGVREAFKWSATDAASGQAIWYRKPGQHYWDARFARDHDGRSVEEEARDPASLLARYQRLLALRRAHAALRTGTQRVLDSAPGLLVIERAGAGERLLLVANLTAAPVTYEGARGRDLIGGGGALVGPWQTALFAAEGGGR